MEDGSPGGQEWGGEATAVARLGERFAVRKKGRALRALNHQFFSYCRQRARSPLGVRGHRGLRLHQREWSSEWSRGMSKTRQRIRQGTGSEPVRIHSLHLSMGETTLSLPSLLTCTH